MPAHGVPGLFRRVGADRIEYRLVLFFDPAEVFAHAFRAAVIGANALPWDDQASEKFQKLDEAIVLGGRRNRQVESEILLDGTLAVGNGAAEHLLRFADRLD